jgi:ribonuclease HI
LCKKFFDLHKNIFTKQSQIENTKMPKETKTKKYYAVRAGVTPGIFSTWVECEKQVRGYNGAQFKSFPTYEMARVWLEDKTETKKSVGEGLKAFLINKPAKVVPKSATAKAVTKQIEYPIPTKILKEFTPFNHPTDRKTVSLKDAQERIDFQQSDLALSTVDYTIVYTDGSCCGGKGNGKEGCVAGIGAWFGYGDARNFGEPFTLDNPTNQRAEIMAVLKVLQSRVSDDENVRIFTDSMYVINSCIDWRIGWSKKNWQTSKGPVANLDLFSGLFNLLDSRTGGVRFEHVRGHKGIEGNENADKLAVMGSTIAKQGKK